MPVLKFFHPEDLPKYKIQEFQTFLSGKIHCKKQKKDSEYFGFEIHIIDY